MGAWNPWEEAAMRLACGNDCFFLAGLFPPLGELTSATWTCTQCPSARSRVLTRPALLEAHARFALSCTALLGWLARGIMDPDEQDRHSKGMFSVNADHSECGNRRRGWHGSTSIVPTWSTSVPSLEFCSTVCCLRSRGPSMRHTLWNIKP